MPPRSEPTIRLRAGSLELELAPQAGGSVAALRGGDRELLRSAPAGSTDPLAMAAFPLVPFCGRIDHGTFELEGRRVRLPADLPGEPHAIHGQGWRHPWRVENAAAATATLTYQHPADAWPWHYAARQTFRLRDQGMTLELALRNLGPTTMPAGLGWHPYFPKADATLWADVAELWPSGTAMIPEGPRPPSEDVGRARLHWPDRTLTLTASDVMSFLVVYVPPHDEAFCVEPLSHVPNAVNDPLPRQRTGLRLLAPGQTIEAWVRLDVRPGEPV